MSTHRVRRARVQLRDPAQQALLRTALPLALQQALDAQAPQPGLLLLRRLPCRVSLAPDAELDDAVQQLRLALQQALQQARQGDGLDEDCLHLPDAGTALVEAFVDALLGRQDRAWAWARLALWPAADAPRSACLAQLAHALARPPLLPPGSWPAGSEPSPTARRWQLWTQLLQRGLLPRLLVQWPLGLPASSSGSAAGEAEAALWLPLLQGLHGSAALLAALREPALAPVPAVGGSWPGGAAAAACLAAWHSTPLPAAQRRPAALICAWLALLHGAPQQLDEGPGQPPPSSPLQALAQRLLQAPAAAPQRPASALKSALVTSAWPSRHAGLLHLLPLLPEHLPARPEGLSRPRLLRLALQGLELPLADPVLAPWLGRHAPAPLQAPDPDPEGVAADRAALHAALEARLQALLDAARFAELVQACAGDLLRWLIQRPAVLYAQAQGWRIAFAEPETQLRRCGLDRDPGSWFGLHLVFSYE
jgi:hypothetical protein